MNNDDRLLRLDEKLDSVVSSINDTKVDISAMKVDLEHHILRTSILENQMSDHSTIMAEFTASVKILKILGTTILTIISVVEAISQIIRHL